jgi:hypothetical protein
MTSLWEIDGKHPNEVNAREEVPGPRVGPPRPLQTGSIVDLNRLRGIWLKCLAGAAHGANASSQHRHGRAG